MNMTPAPDLSGVVMRLEEDLAQARAAYGRVCEERDELREQAGGVYTERARLVAFLAACYPSVRVPDWDDDEYEIIFVTGPTGQMSWRVRVDDPEGLFPHVPEAEHAERDGHTTEQAYERLAGLIPHATDSRDELARARRGAQTLGMVVTRQAQDLYAAWVDVSRGDLEAAAQRVLNSVPDVDDNDPAEQWDGTETGSEWLERTREPFAQGGIVRSPAGGDSVPLALRSGGCPS